MTIDNDNGVGGRDAGGRFSKGNRFGPGNPFGRRVAALRQAMIEAVDDEVMQEIILFAVRNEAFRRAARRKPDVETPDNRGRIHVGLTPRRSPQS